MFLFTKIALRANPKNLLRIYPIPSDLPWFPQNRTKSKRDAWRTAAVNNARIAHAGDPEIQNLSATRFEQMKIFAMSTPYELSIMSGTHGSRPQYGQTGNMGCICSGGWCRWFLFEFVHSSEVSICKRASSRNDAAPGARSPKTLRGILDREARANFEEPRRIDLILFRQILKPLKSKKACGET